MQRIYWKTKKAAAEKAAAKNEMDLQGIAHLLEFLLGGLQILGLGRLHLIPAVLLHELEYLQLILAHLGIAIIENLPQSGIGGFQHFGSDIDQKRLFLIKQIKGQFLIAQGLGGGLLMLVLIPGLILLKHIFPSFLLAPV